MSDAYTDLLLRIFPYDERAQSYPVEGELEDGSRFTGGQLKLDRQALLALQLEAEAYGMTLFNALFAGDIRRAYDKATGIAEATTGGRLRIRLWVDNAAVELHAIPWERIYHLHRGRAVPLGASTLTPFSRYTSLEIREPPPVAEAPIRILAAISNPLDLPSGLAPVDVEAEIDNLRRALSELRRQDKIQVTLLPGRTGVTPELRSKLEKEGYAIVEGTTNLFNIAPHLAKSHIFHFVGHGAFRRRSERGDGQAALYLEKADGAWQAVKDEEILSMFAALGTLPHLIFLVACESARRDAQAESPFVGLAPKLVQAGVPAVVAMQDLVPIDLSRLLAGEFYARLAEHGEVDRALNQSRLQVFDRNRIEWAIPVLFMRIRKGRLFGEEPDAEAPAPGEPPFKGLEYFTENDADKFYGRELLTAKLTGKLRTSRFLPVIIGASGSGKSSVVRAGVLPALKRGTPLADGTLPPEGSTAWQVHIVTPTARPLEALASSLTRDAESLTATTALIDDLRKDERTLHLTVRKILSWSGGSRLVLVVDQFEEVFTQCKDEAERKAFIDNLIYASSEQTDGPTIVIIVFRADFYAHCAQYHNLREAVSTKQEFVGPMTPAELRRAIEEPARAGGWDFEPGLVDVILKEVGDEPGALPLMQHALLETWKRRRGRLMTLRGYAEAGGIRGAIAKTAEAVYQELSPEQQAIARRIFLRLVELGEGAQDTRRRAGLAELSPRAEEKPLVDAALKKLVDNRLVVTTEATAEVAHEALIREWPRLHEWIDQNREGLRIHRDLTKSAHDWDYLMRESGVLYRGLRLVQALEWAADPDHAAEMTELEREFLTASEENYEREEREKEEQQQRELEAARRIAEEQSRAARAAEQAAEAERKRAEQEAQAAARQRRLTRIIATVAVVAFVAAVVAGVLGVIAQQQSSLALSSQLDTAAAALPATRLDRQLLLRVLAYDTAPTSQVFDNLLASLKKTAVLRYFLRGHTGKINALAYRPESEQPILVSGGEDHTVRLWDVRQGQAIGDPLAGHTDQVRAVAFSPLDGDLLVSTGDDGLLFLWDTGTGQPLKQIQLGAPGRSLAFSADGKAVAVGKGDGSIDRRDAASLESIGDLLAGHAGAVASLAFSYDNYEDAKLYSGGQDKMIRVWDAASGRLLNEKQAAGEVTTLAVSDGGFLVSGDTTIGVELWDGSDLNRIQSAPVTPGGQPLLVGFNSDEFGNTSLIYADNENHLADWQWELNQISLPLLGYEGPVDSAAFTRSLDGLEYAASLGDAILVWAAQSARQLQPDLDSAAQDPAQARALACRLAGRSLSPEEWRLYLPDYVPYRQVCEASPAGQ